MTGTGTEFQDCGTSCYLGYEKFVRACIALCVEFPVSPDPPMFPGD